jgi:hypothetical protein
MSAKLSKRDVEALLAGYDTDPIDALTVALRVVLDQPDASFDTLVASAPIGPRRRRDLVARDLAALDALARELNETRGLES